MARIEILTEEPSMKEVLEVILPKILPAHWILGSNYFIRPHSGKSDLQKSIPNKVKVFSNYHEPVGIVILHDQDSADCKMLKKSLLNICQTNGSCPILVRIVCRELESWYLGDLNAIELAYPKSKASKHLKAAKYRKPDELVNASEEIKKIVPEFQKVSSARAIAHHLEPVANQSESFKQFVRGVLAFFNDF